MKILTINKFWYPRGGLERVMFDEISSLEGSGHQVAHLSTAHPYNIDSPWSRYFVDYLELGGASALSARGKSRALFRMFSNRSARDSVRRLIDEFRPDVVHAHGVHRQLSGGVLSAANAAGVPVVQTVHDYHHLCPADNLLRQGERPCAPRLCHGGDFTACVSNRCVRGSLPVSLLSAAEMTWRSRSGGFRRFVRFFICPSQFMSEQMQGAGFAVNQLRLLRNTAGTASDLIADPPSADDPEERPYYLFIGRLVNEKGVNVLLEAARRASVDLLIAGEGPDEPELRAAYSDEIASGCFRFLGHVKSGEVLRLMRGARAVVVPSIWFENASISVLEAMSVGAPLIVSAIGGLTEMVEDGVTGLHCEPGSVDSLCSALQRIEGDPAAAASLGEAGARLYKERYSAQAHADGLMRIYDEAIAAGAVR